MEKLTIIGGGMTGLAIAYIAAKQGIKVTILEGSDKIGGLLNTFEIGGNQLEHYYHHFFTHDAELNWLLKDLGIEHQTFYKKTTMGFFRHGKIYDFNTPFDLLKFKPVNFLGKLRFGFTSLFLGKVANWRKNEDVSTYDWFMKWAGENATNAIWKPMLDIKFGPYSKQVPLSWMIGRMAQRLNSRKGGDERLGYIKGSWKTLLEALKKRLIEMGVEILVNEKVTKFNIENNQLLGVETSTKTFERGNFVCTIPQTYLKPLLGNDSHKIGGEDIEYFGAVCTILELKKQFSNIYWMNVADEGFPFGGVIEHTNLIPKEEYGGSHIIYLSRYFAMSEKLATMSEEEIKAVMIPPLKRINPNFSEDWIKNVFVFRTFTGATVCDLNFSEKVPSCQTSIKNLYLANMAHVYPDERSTNNSIRVAAEACRVMGINSSFVPEGNSLSGKIGF